jgi:hypothetical protein
MGPHGNRRPAPSESENNGGEGDCFGARRRLSIRCSTPKSNTYTEMFRFTTLHDDTNLHHRNKPSKCSIRPTKAEIRNMTASANNRCHDISPMRIERLVALFCHVGFEPIPAMTTWTKSPPPVCPGY